MHRYFAGYVATMDDGGRFHGEVTWDQPTPLRPEDLKSLRDVIQDTAPERVGRPTITSIYKFED